MVSTATLAARANSSIRYSTSDHSNDPPPRSAGGGGGRPVAQRHVECGLAGAPYESEGHRVAGPVQLEHAAQRFTVVEVGAVDLLDHVVGLEPRPLGGAAGDHAADHDAEAADRRAAVRGQVAGQVLITDADVGMTRGAPGDQVLGDAPGDQAGYGVADAVCGRLAGGV